MLAALTVLAGILSGYFDRERTELKRNVEALKKEKTALLETQTAIRQASADAEKRLQRLMEMNAKYEEHLNQAQEYAERLARRNAEVEAAAAARRMPKPKE
jgi:predicted nuclease with TOPRIM domain